ncbi:MAG: hypothetical protein KJ070_26905 [Verrucomicrobia bacterium]|nr:hypothetical protein [Verrucomicrobiota bacterium]
MNPSNNGCGSHAIAADDRLQNSHQRPRPRHHPERQSKSQSHRNWTSHPSQLVGKKVRSRKSRATFTMRNIFKNGRVQLEKSSMTYSSDIRMIDLGYEPCV